MGHGDLKTAPPEQVSRAALFGGTTTLMDFAIQYPGIDIPQAIAERTDVWQGNSYADYAHHLMLLGQIPEEIIGSLHEAVEDGFASFKIFTTNIRPPATTGEPRMVGTGHLHDLMTEIQRLSAMLLVHAEDDDMVQHMYQKLTREERTEWHNMSLVHSAESEDVSFRRVLRVAEWTGAPVYFVHVSALQGGAEHRRGPRQRSPGLRRDAPQLLLFQRGELQGRQRHEIPYLSLAEVRG